jgi:large subunit ribosomal protein L17
MRHRVARRKLNRTSEHRVALRRNMAQSLFEHGQIETTLTKAKDLRPFAERCITLARKARQGSLAARQRLVAVLGDRAIISADNQEQYNDMSDAARNRVLRSRSGRRHRLGQARGGQKFTALSVVHHLINTVVGEFEGRGGGYTRVIRLGRVHKGDSAPLAVLQLVGQEESPGTVTRPEKTARQRRTERRYRAAAKAIKGKAPAAQAEDKRSAPEASAGEPAPEPTDTGTPAPAAPSEGEQAEKGPSGG